MCKFFPGLACLAFVSLARRVPLPDERETTKKDNTAFANRPVRGLGRDQSLVELKPLSHSRHLPSASAQALSSLLFLRRNQRSGWQQFGDALSSAATSISTSIGNGVVDYMGRHSRQHRMKKSNHASLLLALLAARLSEIAYADTQEELEKELASPVYFDVPGGFKLLHFRRQGPDENTENAISPQWFLARGALPRWQAKKGGPSVDDGEALYLVFRGTWSTADIIRDACIEPEEQKNSGTFHGGFLKGVREDSDLHAHLLRAMRHGCNHLYVFGHSLGGSCAMTLVAAELLPSWYKGSVTVVGIGAPPMIATMNASAVANSASNRKASSSRPTPRYVLVVNDCDVFPRLLGSPMPVSLSRMLASSASTTSPMQQALMERNVELMETMQQYSHPEGIETILLRGGRAMDVPSEDLESVLHFGEVVSTSLLDDHRTRNYVRELEIAATLAEVFQEQPRRGRRGRK